MQNNKSTNNIYPTELHKLLKLNYSEKDKIWLSNQNTLRKLIGILGILLPVLLYITTGCHSPLESISHYYYTRVCSIFVVIVSLWGIFLIIYKGHQTLDFIISSIAGLFALCVVLFPTDNISIDPCDISVTTLHNVPFRVGFHYASAGIFLGCLAYMSICLFTKSNKSVKDRGRMKRIRNRIYRTCGTMMALALAFMFLHHFCDVISDSFYDSHRLTFCFETLAVVSFGFSWLIKGESFFKD